MKRKRKNQQGGHDQSGQQHGGQPAHLDQQQQGGGGNPGQQQQQNPNPNPHPNPNVNDMDADEDTSWRNTGGPLM
jgi:hypothetical protein